MTIRYCFNCLKKLVYEDFLNTEDRNFTRKEKRKIWKNKSLILFCCSCNNSFKSGQLTIEKIETKLREYENEISKIKKRYRILTKRFNTSKYIKLDKFITTTRV